MPRATKDSRIASDATGALASGNCSASSLVGYSITLLSEFCNAEGVTFKEGARLCVKKAWRGLIRCCEYSGCGSKGELRWIPPTHVKIWRPTFGQTYAFLPEDGIQVRIIAIEERGPGWHRALFPDGREIRIHDQEIREMQNSV